MKRGFGDRQGNQTERKTENRQTGRRTGSQTGRKVGLGTRKVGRLTDRQTDKRPGSQTDIDRQNSRVGADLSYLGTLNRRSRSGLIFCWAWSGSTLFANVTSRRVDTSR